MMPRRTVRTNLFRVFISGLVAGVVTLALLFFLGRFAGVDFSDLTRALVTSYVIAWPLNVVIYVVWSFRAYSRLDSASLRQASVADDVDEQRPVARVLNVTGATNTTITAAVVAIIVTVIIAQHPQIRGEPIYIVLTLATVASSWVLMVFSFAQGYLRLGAGGREGAHFRFHFPDPPRFSDYLTVALMLSASSATLSADITSRAAWQLVRANAIIAFIFNSVIIAMMVSLLFGGLLG